MNKLEEMKNSCKVFAADLKTGDIEWSKDVHHENGFITKWNDNKIRFYIIHEIGTEGQPCYFKLESFFYRGYVLQSTTAKESAHEALQLVRAEAQKLVDALEPKEDFKFDGFDEYCTPKEPFWIPIDYNNLPRMKVIVKTGYGDYIEGIIGTDSGNGLDYILCYNTKERYYTTFTHYHDISKYPLPQ